MTKQNEISPIDQFRKKLKINVERKNNLHETLDLLNEVANYNNHLTIGGCFISTESVKKVIWATIEIDVISRDDIKENKDDRMCPIATHIEHLNSVREFHSIVFNGKSKQDLWKIFVDEKKILPLSTVIDRCLNSHKKDDIPTEMTINAEYFIVIFPSCTESEKSSLFNWLLYKQGRAVFFEPVVKDDNTSYVIRHINYDQNSSNTSVEEFWDNYDPQFSGHRFQNFVDWIIQGYNSRLDVKKSVVFYAGYCFKDFEDARLWTAFTDDIREDDLYAAESLLYRLHQKQIDVLMRETLIKHPVANLWSEEKKDWFINSNENQSEIVVTHNLPDQHDGLNLVKKTINDFLSKYITRIPNQWLEEQIVYLYESLKVLCGKSSITQGDRQNQAYSQKELTLNALYLVSALAIGQKINSDLQIKQLLEGVHFLENDIAITESKTLSLDNGKKIIESFFDLIQGLCLNDQQSEKWQLINIELKSNSLKFKFDFNMKQIKSGRTNSLLESILKHERIGSLTCSYFDLQAAISTLTVGDSNFHKNTCVINLYPSLDFKYTYLEIQPIKALNNIF